VSFPLPRRILMSERAGVNGIYEEGTRFTVQGAGNTKELKKIMDARLRGHDGSVRDTEKPSLRGYRAP